MTSLPVNSCHACAPHNTYTLPGYVLIDQHAGSFLFVGMPSINIRLIVLRCSCRCFLRISPAAELLLTRFLRQGAPPPRPQRPAPRISSRGVARARARPRRRNIQRVFPQSTGLSCPLSDLPQRVATGAICYSDSFGGVVSGLRSPRGIGCPAAAAVVGTCAGDL